MVSAYVRMRRALQKKSTESSPGERMCPEVGTARGLSGELRRTSARGPIGAPPYGRPGSESCRCLWSGFQAAGVDQVGEAEGQSGADPEGLWATRSETGALGES